MGANENITQLCKVVEADRKVRELTKLFLEYNISEKGRGENRALIFCNTRKMCETLEEGLNRARVNCDSIHGDRSQAEREKAMDDLRDGRTKILCCTDVAARGLDIQGVTLVVNYDPPKNAEDYVHRIGRTGRAGKKGTSVTFLTIDDARLAGDIKIIMQRSKQEVPEKVLSLIDGTLRRKKSAVDRERERGDYRDVRDIRDRDRRDDYRRGDDRDRRDRRSRSRRDRRSRSRRERRSRSRRDYKKDDRREDTRRERSRDDER